MFFSFLRAAAFSDRHGGEKITRTVDGFFTGAGLIIALRFTFFFFFFFFGKISTFLFSQKREDRRDKSRLVSRVRKGKEKKKK